MAGARISGNSRWNALQAVRISSRRPTAAPYSARLSRLVWAAKGTNSGASLLAGVSDQGQS